MRFKCCVCGSAVPDDDQDSYLLQVRRIGATSPEALMSHGPCLRKVIPVVGVEIPKPSQP